MKLIKYVIEGACPCLHTTPCHDRCACVNKHSSVGCRRCCSYGSKEQQKTRAEFLANAIDTFYMEQKGSANDESQ